jgi:hypothetical protein
VYLKWVKEGSHAYQQLNSIPELNGHMYRVADGRWGLPFFLRLVRITQLPIKKMAKEWTCDFRRKTPFALTSLLVKYGPECELSFERVSVFVELGGCPIISSNANILKFNISRNAYLKSFIPAADSLDANYDKDGDQYSAVVPNVGKLELQVYDRTSTKWLAQLLLASVRNSSITLIRSLSEMASLEVKSKGGPKTLLSAESWGNLRGICFLPISDDQQILKLAKAAGYICTPSNHEVCFTQRETISSDIFGFLRKDDDDISIYPNMDYAHINSSASIFMRKLGIPDEVETDVVLAHVIQVGKEVDTKVRRYNELRQYQASSLLAAKGRRSSRASFVTLSTGVDVRASIASSTVLKAANAFKKKAAKGEVAPIVPVTDDMYTEIKDLLKFRNLVTIAYTEAGRRIVDLKIKEPSKGRELEGKLKANLGTVRCLWWPSSSGNSEDVAIMPSFVFYVFDAVEWHKKRFCYFSAWHDVFRQ